MCAVMEATLVWTRVCRFDELTPLGARVVKSVHGNIAVSRNADDEVFALRDKCPHKGGPLSQGIVFGQQVACPLHNWTIGLSDGQAQEPDHGCTPSFAVKVVDGKVHLLASELTAHAIDVVRPVAGPVTRKAQRS